jgi:hypothetical protein
MPIKIRCARGNCNLALPSVVWHPRIQSRFDLCSQKYRSKTVAYDTFSESTPSRKYT